MNNAKQNKAAEIVTLAIVAFHALRDSTDILDDATPDTLRAAQTDALKVVKQASKALKAAGRAGLDTTEIEHASVVAFEAFGIIADMVRVSEGGTLNPCPANVLGKSDEYARMLELRGRW